MNYIQEELLRQKRLLTELLLREGGSTARNYESAEETEMLTYVSGNTVAQQVEARAGRTVFAGNRAQRRSVAVESAEHEAIPSYRETNVVSEPFWKRGRQNMAGQGGADSVVVRQRTGGVGGTQTDARALSRAVQRDARRYDGGFSIY